MASYSMGLLYSHTRRTPRWVARRSSPLLLGKATGHLRQRRGGQERHDLARVAVPQGLVPLGNLRPDRSDLGVHQPPGSPSRRQSLTVGRHARAPTAFLPPWCRTPWVAT